MACGSPGTTRVTITDTTASFVGNVGAILPQGFYSGMFES
jgi:hypothetical protein